MTKKSTRLLIEVTVYLLTSTALGALSEALLAGMNWAMVAQSRVLSIIINCTLFYVYEELKERRCKIAVGETTSSFKVAIQALAILMLLQVASHTTALIVVGARKSSVEIAVMMTAFGSIALWAWDIYLFPGLVRTAFYTQHFNGRK